MNVQEVETDERFVSATVNPPTATRLQPGVTVLLHKATAIYDDNNVKSVDIEVDLAGDEFTRAFTRGWFGLTAESRGPSLIEGDFDPSLPCHLKLRLNAPEVAALNLPLADTAQMQQAIIDVVAHLLSPPTGSTLASASAFTYVTALQEMGDGVRGGYRNLNLPEDA